MNFDNAVIDSTPVQPHPWLMATLTIRNLPDEIRDRLRVRAAENGRSMEAEARDMLQRELTSRPPMGEAERRRRLKAVQQAMEPFKSSQVLASEELIAERRLEAWTEAVEAMHHLRDHGPYDIEAALARLRGAHDSDT